MRIAQSIGSPALRTRQITRASLHRLFGCAALIRGVRFLMVIRSVRKVCLSPLGVLILTGILCATLYLSSVSHGDQHKWQPTSFPVDLGVGSTRAAKFRVSLGTTYSIFLEAERTLPFQRLTCLLGVEDSWEERCKAMSSPLKLSWVVTSDGIRVADGNSDKDWGGMFTTKTICRMVGEFAGGAGKTYDIQVTSLRDATALAPANPKITVQVHPSESEPYVKAALFNRIAAIGIGVLGLIVAACWYVIRALFHEKANPGITRPPTKRAAGDAYCVRLQGGRSIDYKYSIIVPGGSI